MVDDQGQSQAGALAGTERESAYGIISTTFVKGYHLTNTKSQTYSHSLIHIFLDSGAPKGNFHRHGEIFQTPCRKAPSQLAGLKPEPACCEATDLTTEPVCHLFSHQDTRLYMVPGGKIRETYWIIWLGIFPKVMHCNICGQMSLFVLRHTIFPRIATTN